MSYRSLPHNLLPARDLATTNHARRFLSIKWKALLLATLVLVSIFDAFSMSRYLNLLDPFERQQQVTRDHNRQEMAALIDQSARRLQQIGGSIYSLGAIDGIAIGPEVGTCAIAVHTAKVVSTPDVGNDPHWCDLKDLPLTLDLRAA